MLAAAALSFADVAYAGAVEAELSVGSRQERIHLGFAHRGGSPGASARRRHAPEFRCQEGVTCLWYCASTPKTTAAVLESSDRGGSLHQYRVPRCSHRPILTHSSTSTADLINPVSQNITKLLG